MSTQELRDVSNRTLRDDVYHALTDEALGNGLDEPLDELLRRLEHAEHKWHQWHLHTGTYGLTCRRCDCSSLVTAEPER